jgi:bifunctional non-homologous end joining protein LigD
VSVYSLRARDEPTVSTPVEWKEVERALKREDPDLLRFEAGDVLKRIDKRGDLFAPVAERKQKLPDLSAATKSD